MPATPELVIGIAVGGMNDSIHPVALPLTQSARMVNCQIKNQLIATRPGIRAHKLGGDADAYRASNTQGAIYYNPIRGQSQQIFATNKDSLVVAAGGRLYQVTISPLGDPVFSDVTGGAALVSDAHTVHIYQAENYAIAQDGYSPTWIWDGRATAVPSPGYDEDDPQGSWLANGATVGGYVHGRIVQVVGGNRILVGNIIHSNGQNDPVAVLKTSEQVYFASGSSFSPPSNMGEVLAFGILPLSNTTHGHDGAIFHCRRGCFSLKLDHFPRTDWANLAISRHLLIDAAAVGPYALVLHDGDQIFRSRLGVQTIRSAASDTSIIGNPNQPISEPVDSWTNADHGALLRFCSMARWGPWNRIFATTGLWADGAYRGGTGILSLNLNTDGSMRSGEEQRAWEGLWTLPPEIGRPVQLVNGQFQESDRMFVLTSVNECGTERAGLAEIAMDLKHDVLEDGSISEISCQVVTAEVPREGVLYRSSLAGGLMAFEAVEGPFTWGVWVRNDAGDSWALWQSGNVEASEACDPLKKSAAMRVRINLAEGPEAKRRGPRFQFLIRWRGFGQLVGLTANLERTNAPNERPESGVEVLEGFAPCDYNDYEYLNGTTWDQET